MKTCEIEKIVNGLIDKNVAFSLMAVAKDDDGLCDQYYCSGNEDVSPKELMEITISDLASHMLEDGNKIEDVKAFFEIIIDEVYNFHSDNKKLS